jgi:hypothetical protein
MQEVGKKMENYCSWVWDSSELMVAQICEYNFLKMDHTL